jgi:acrylyl-CoA reductase (NADPH)
MSFKAFRVERIDSGFVRSIVEREENDLPEGDLLIEVKYSSLNFKDGLSATGKPSVTKKFPHTPGIDAAGIVKKSNHSEFNPGDKVIAIGFDLGMGTSGGFSERIRIPAEWAVKCPDGLTMHSSMIIGTAGFTAAESVQKLEQAGMTPQSGPVLVTGATGGVGSVAIKLLAQLGYEVTAVTGKAEKVDWIKMLGATSVITREEALEGNNKPMLPEKWGGVVDTVGGDILFNGVKSLRYGCSLAACGLVASPTFGASVLPFILRHVNLLGIDSVNLPIQQKTAIWERLSSEWLMDLSDLEEVLTMEKLSDSIDRILTGKMVGRGVLHL